MPQQENRNGLTIYPDSALALSSYAIEGTDTPDFLQTAKRWLGLIIDPHDIKQSQITEERVRTFIPKYEDDRSFAQYGLMVRIYLATATEKLIREGLTFTDEVSGINTHINTLQSSVDNPNKSDAEEVQRLFIEINKKKSDLMNTLFFYPKADFFRHIYYLPQNSQHDKVIEQRKRELEGQFNDYYKDLNHDINSTLGGPKNWGDFILLNLQNQNRLEDNIYQFNIAWQEGNTLALLRHFARGHQEKMIAGFSERISDPGIDIQRIIKHFAIRYKAQMIANGETVINQLGQDTINLSYDPEENLGIPINSGLLAVVVRNLLVNAFTHKSSPSGNVNLSINIHYIDGNFILTFKDNGLGFDQELLLTIISSLYADESTDQHIFRKQIEKLFTDPLVGEQVAEAVGAYVSGNRTEIDALSQRDLNQLFLLDGITESILEPNQGRTPGRGLGIVKRLVQSAGGSMILDNVKERHGALIEITLPERRDRRGLELEDFPRT
jgi:hypothetical protein